MQVRVVDGEATRELRRVVLRPSWPVGSAMHGDDDPTAVHLAAVEGPEIVGACVLLARAYPLRAELPSGWQLRGMAIAADRQRRGIGGHLLAAAFSEIGRRGGRLIWCDARIAAAPFYAQHGFVAEGAEFPQAETGLPHVRMWRELPGPDTSSSLTEVRKSGRA